MTVLRLIGFWRNEQHPEYPSPADWVDAGWDDEERHAVWHYLASGTMLHAWMGFSPCRMCGKDNGALDFTDDTYVWPEGLAHYVYDHDIRLPGEFVEHALRRQRELEEAESSVEWWLRETSR